MRKRGVGGNKKKYIGVWVRRRGKKWDESRKKKGEEEMSDDAEMR